MQPLITKILDLFLGNLSTRTRIWSALLPAMFILGYFLIGLLIYGFKLLRSGPHQDPEIAKRGSSILLGMGIRQYFAWIIQPIWNILLWIDLPANALTTLSVLLATGAGVAVGAGRFALSGWLYVASGICDFFDGRIARRKNTASPAGSALDSVLDRYSDGIVLVGLSWYYRSSLVLVAIGILMISTFLVSYIRAKGESLNVVMKDIGLMQRPERIVYLGLAIALSPILEALYNPNESNPPHLLAILAICIIAASTSVTAVRRLLYLLHQLSDNSRAKWFGLRRGSLFRFAVSSTIATVADFIVVLLFVEFFHFLPWNATICGCFLGAIVNFSINRVWAFRTNDVFRNQIFRYTFVSGSSALLNAGGVAVLLFLPAIDYRLAWLIARGNVFLLWNYPLNRDYVFVEKERTS